MKRSTVIQLWFAAVVLGTVCAVALGVSMTTSTGVLLAALALIPPGLVMALWPRTEPMTAGQVLRGTDRSD